jgi:hypothetical protein
MSQKSTEKTNNLYLIHKLFTPKLSYIQVLMILFTIYYTMVNERQHNLYMKTLYIGNADIIYNTIFPI